VLTSAEVNWTYICRTIRGTSRNMHMTNITIAAIRHDKLAYRFHINAKNQTQHIVIRPDDTQRPYSTIN